MKEIKLASQSYGRACLNPNFLNRFYEIFLESHPEIKPMFEHTDFKKQKQLLKKSIIMLLAYFEGEKTWEQDLRALAERHSIHGGLTISPNLYQYWIASMIAALKEHDPLWTSDLEQTWMTVLQAGIDFLTVHYDPSDLPPVES